MAEIYEWEQDPSLLFYILGDKLCKHSFEKSEDIPKLVKPLIFHNLLELISIIPPENVLILAKRNKDDYPVLSNKCKKIVSSNYYLYYIFYGNIQFYQDSTGLYNEFSVFSKILSVPSVHLFFDSFNYDYLDIYQNIREFNPSTIRFYIEECNIRKILNILDDYNKLYQIIENTVNSKGKIIELTNLKIMSNLYCIFDGNTIQKAVENFERYNNNARQFLIRLFSADPKIFELSQDIYSQYGFDIQQILVINKAIKLSNAYVLNKFALFFNSEILNAIKQIYSCNHRYIDQINNFHYSRLYPPHHDIKVIPYLTKDGQINHDSDSLILPIRIAMFRTATEGVINILTNVRGDLIGNDMNIEIEATEKELKMMIGLSFVAFTAHSIHPAEVDKVLSGTCNERWQEIITSISAICAKDKYDAFMAALESYKMLLNSTNDILSSYKNVSSTVESRSAIIGSLSEETVKIAIARSMIKLGKDKYDTERLIQYCEMKETESLDLIYDDVFTSALIISKVKKNVVLYIFEEAQRLDMFIKKPNLDQLSELPSELKEKTIENYRLIIGKMLRISNENQIRNIKDIQKATSLKNDNENLPPKELIDTILVFSNTNVLGALALYLILKEHNETEEIININTCFKYYVTEKAAKRCLLKRQSTVKQSIKFTMKYVLEKSLKIIKKLSVFQYRMLNKTVEIMKKVNISIAPRSFIYDIISNEFSSSDQINQFLRVINPSLSEERHQIFYMLCYYIRYKLKKSDSNEISKVVELSYSQLISSMRLAVDDVIREIPLSDYTTINPIINSKIVEKKLVDVNKLNSSALKILASYLLGILSLQPIKEALNFDSLKEISHEDISRMNEKFKKLMGEQEISDSLLLIGTSLFTNSKERKHNLRNRNMPKYETFVDDYYSDDDFQLISNGEDSLSSDYESEIEVDHIEELKDK